jgi:hypothetical protein
MTELVRKLFMYDGRLAVGDGIAHHRVTRRSRVFIRFGCHQSALKVHARLF